MIYEQRRDLLCARSPPGWAMRSPSTSRRAGWRCGCVNPDIDAAAWAAGQRRSGLILTHGGLQLQPGPGRNAFRIGFASLDEAEASPAP